MLSVEISTIYKKGDKTRKIHHLLYVPTLEQADLINRKLDRIGNIKSDGRPILGLDSRHLLEIVLEAGEGCYLVPAHIWTPWFAVLGSKSGFDSIDECYGDLAEHIFAVEDRPLLRPGHEPAGLRPGSVSSGLQLGCAFPGQTGEGGLYIRH